MRYIAAIITILISTLLYAGNAGGEAELLTTATVSDSNSIETDILESIDVELFIPRLWGHDIKFEAMIYKPVQAFLPDEDLSVFMKKLYLRLRFKYINITLGRQPVSWSFGAMLNPVDFALGSVALNEETNSKYTDAAEIYIPINWNSGLSAIAAFPYGISSEPDSVKWGARARFGIRGYDITLNYVREPDILDTAVSAIPVNSIIPLQRAACTVKGDIWDLGVYGSFGYYFSDSVSTVSCLAGADYSFNYNYDRKVVLQAEYMGIDMEFLNPMLRNAVLLMDSSETWFNLITASVNAGIDDFSSFTVFSIINANDWSAVICPIYQVTLPLKINLELSGYIFAGRENTLFRPGPVMPRAIGMLSLKYKF